MRLRKSGGGARCHLAWFSLLQNFSEAFCTKLNVSAQGMHFVSFNTIQNSHCNSILEIDFNFVGAQKIGGDTQYISSKIREQRWQIGITVHGSTKLPFPCFEYFVPAASARPCLLHSRDLGMAMLPSPFQPLSRRFCMSAFCYGEVYGTLVLRSSYVYCVGHAKGGPSPTWDASHILNPHHSSAVFVIP